MKIGLFIPCYIEQFYPNVGVATLELLEKLGLEVEYPLDQTCCGQPMANSGCENDSFATTRLFKENFKNFDYIVGPSGSCVLHIKEHAHLDNVFELCEFLTDIVKVNSFEKIFSRKVGLHVSCHGQRGLGLAQSSEIVGEDYSKMRNLLDKIKGLDLIELERKDECCGFGGTFAVAEEAVSVKMGKDRIKDHIAHEAEILTGGDMSCLMHLEGLINRQGNSIKVMHIAEILNQAM
ncbi:(Fe-S)-binding protein [Flexithrix dorotheae]|uniref:(Fe-S)-binding protein n=1 Tax=Flexithrix dorotheae TaxID=70993 RepID=UPI0003719634|nr:(Fe-S)-binding protein [Flexithrix dorotheae]